MLSWCEQGPRYNHRERDRETGKRETDRQTEIDRETETKKDRDRDRQKEIQTAYCITKVSQIQVCCIMVRCIKEDPDSLMKHNIKGFWSLTV